MREAERSWKLRRELRQASEMPQCAAVSSMPTLCLSSLHNRTCLRTLKTALGVQDAKPF